MNMNFLWLIFALIIVGWGLWRIHKESEDSNKGGQHD